MARVCMIAFTDYPVDTRVRREAEALVGRGDEVDFICLRTPSLGDRTVLNGVALHPVMPYDYRDGARPQDYIRRYGRFHVAAFGRVLSLHLRRRYDLVHVDTMPDSLVFCALGAKLLGAKVLLDVHDLMPELYASKFALPESHWAIRTLRAIERRSVAFADRALAVHGPHLDALVSHGNPREKFTVLMNVPDSGLFQPRAAAPPASPFVLVYHGTIGSRHGIEVAVRSIDLVRHRVPDVELRVVGDGDAFESVRALVAELGLERWVRLHHGLIPMEELLPRITEASVGVVPILDDPFTRYMLPVKLLEYVALGIPVIASDTSTIRAHFDDDTLCFAQAADPVDLAAKIVAVHADPDLRSRLAAAGLRFSAEHTWELEKERYLALVDSMISRTSRRQSSGFADAGCEAAHAREIRAAHEQHAGSDDRRETRRRPGVTQFDCDVAVVGAGPYGLSTAAHIDAADGLDVRVFGEPMTFWQHKMPVGMLLRSPWPACSLSDPEGAGTLDRFRAAHRGSFGEPVPLDRFVEYGRWFQRSIVPATDPRQVRRVESSDGGFGVELADGERIRARRVVVAAGIEQFAWRPPEFGSFPRELVSHTVDHRDLTAFSGKRVIVAGGGQSGLESAALLHEAGADVEVLVKHPEVFWLTRRWQHRTPVVSDMLYAWPDVGPAFVSHLVARPAAYRRMPRRAQDRLAKRSIRAAGAAWLVPRLRQVPIRTGVGVADTTRVNGHVELRLDDGSRRTADHVLLATGYRVDVAKYGFLAPELVDGVKRVNGHPRLDHGFQSTVPGLHFVGAPAAWSHGPLLRFVAGADFAARSVARALVPGRG